MPEFRFEAVDATGRSRRGLLEGPTARAVRDQLRGDGLFPTAVEPAIPRGAMRSEATRIAAPLLALITRQLATLVASGMPLDTALAAVAQQSDQAAVARVLEAIRDQVAAGEPLAAALSRFPRTFSELYRGLVAVGAETGQLGIVLSRLADYLEARQALRQEFVMALVYPALLAAIADRADPRWRASAVGVYRFWRDMGYAVGAVVAGALADAFGLRPAIVFVGALTLVSGVIVAARMTEH